MRNASALKPRVVTVLSRADVMDVCQVMLHRCGLSAAQLAQHMGEPLQAPSAAAPKPAANPAAPITPRTAEALGFAARPEGASISELQQLMGISMQTAFAYLDTLAKRGLVTRAKSPGTRNWKYFAEGAAAQREPVSRGGGRPPHAAEPDHPGSQHPCPRPSGRDA